MTGRRNSRRSARGRRDGFTLVELLIVVTIIGLLAGMVYAALNAARTAAQTAKTKTTITKLHYLVLGKYDSYRTRRVAVDLNAYIAAHDGNPATETNFNYVVGGPDMPLQLARARVNTIRDLMRMEMPDRWTDIFNFSNANPPVPLDSGAEAYGKRVPLTEINPPSLLMVYRNTYLQAYKANGNDSSKLADNAAAECLYMIVMNIPEAAEQFHANEVGDVDNDGLPEFIDGWGRPIRFLRWPAGFYLDAAADYFGDGELQFGPQLLPSEKVKAIPLQNPNFRPDPFDPRNAVTAVQDGFATFPLIYSAGPDGRYDINMGKDNTGAPWWYQLDPANKNINPFQNDGNGVQFGRPFNDEATLGNTADYYIDLDHYDNVHNHRLQTGRGG
jgi:prepilin-type N-terminal cleavage/methylation domain-containing protein